MAVDLNELLARCVQVEKEALTALSPSVSVDSQPNFIYVGEGFPYIVHRISGDDIQYDSEDMDRDIYTVIIRLVIGHVTSGYTGVNETALYTYIPVIINAFNSNEGLTSVTYPSEMTSLIEATENRMKSCRGFSVFLDGGLKDVKQVGTEFTLTCEFNDDL